MYLFIRVGLRRYQDYRSSELDAGVASWHHDSVGDGPSHRKDGAMACTVDSKFPAHVYTRLLDKWIMPFGAPQRVIFDGGGEFEREA